MKKYFFIDYDNTIFSHYTRTIPESAADALRSLQKAGHMVFLASGRGLSAELLPNLPAGFTLDGLVGANGAIVQAEGLTLWENPMDTGLKSRIIDYVMKRGYFMVTSSEGDFYVSSMERYNHSLFRKTEPIPPKGDEAFLTLCSKPVFSFFLHEPLEIIEEMQRDFPDLKLFYMGGELGGADVIPAENGKVKGIERILAHYGASISDAVAIGDSMNDLEMIRAAGIGIAIGNAMPEVKKAADYVAKAIDDGGLADAISYGLTHYSGEKASEAISPDSPHAIINEV